MPITQITVAQYIENLPEERKPAFTKLYETVTESLPPGFAEGMNYGMIGWHVPLDQYPAGYHCTPGSPLPFVNLASQKNFIALYHMGIYADPELLNWFADEFPKHSKRKLDMGKSCIRFKKVEDIPYGLIADLMKKMSVQQWISLYEKLYKK